LLTLLKLTLTLILAAALGLGATYLAVQRGRGFGAVSVGAWTAWPMLGSSNADPYARAILSRTGEIPLGLAEGLMFTARTDDAGEPLLAACSYVVAGAMPAGRAWTLTLANVRGFLVDNPARRHGFTSQEIVRAANGGFQIVVSRAARAGNWLPLGSVRQFTLGLRIYDTPLSATAATLDRTAMPSIKRERCS